MSVAVEMQSLLQWRRLFMAWQVANCVTMNWEIQLAEGIVLSKVGTDSSSRIFKIFQNDLSSSSQLY
jgi:hypothetical protein